ncbi:unnamed protein product [Rotaria sp. Silwood1]|nr:unnamed protein product [Rotaria sp. Silwood1]CAF1580240.1 unnamed protein product [Rotaria sp. Silwood1]CAF3724156.1 unnamed protein product [Rotaria sp. Silwood1]CAF3757741.1 unnamed protein product [Rotaria sp. Silwood1]CAF5022826.1 unnamed protein product [Rotaria sp. Silwood1]
MDKEIFRFYLKVRTALNIQPTIIHDELHTVFGNESLSFRTVARWSKWFREGREEIEDETRPGRPITEATSENIEQVHSIINDEPYITVKELQAQTDLSHGTS